MVVQIARGHGPGDSGADDDDVGMGGQGRGCPVVEEEGRRAPVPEGVGRIRRRDSRVRGRGVDMIV